MFSYDEGKCSSMLTMGTDPWYSTSKVIETHTIEHEINLFVYLFYFEDEYCHVANKGDLKHKLYFTPPLSQKLNCKSNLEGK